MTAKPSLPACDISILNRLIRPERGDLSAAGARDLLKIDFEPSDHDRMHELSLKAQEGALNAGEQTEMDAYEQAGYLLALLHSKARQCLKKR
jgi:hypothetical protein